MKPVPVQCQLERNVFTKDEISAFEAAVKYIPFQQSGTYRAGAEHPAYTDYRKSQQKSVFIDHPFIHKLLFRVFNINRKFYKLPITQYLNQVDFLLYDQVGDHFDWHTDPIQTKEVTDRRRKISTIVFLSDTKDYDGAKLYFRNEQDQTFRVDQEQGFVVHFNSLAMHRVTPLTQGTRKVIIAWSG